MSEYKGGPDGPEGADDGYVDHGRMYYVDVGDATLEIDLETDEAMWSRDGKSLREASGYEVALARRIEELEAERDALKGQGYVAEAAVESEHEAYADLKAETARLRKALRDIEGIAWGKDTMISGLRKRIAAIAAAERARIGAALREAIADIDSAHGHDAYGRGARDALQAVRNTIERICGPQEPAAPAEDWKALAVRLADTAERHIAAEEKLYVYMRSVPDDCAIVPDYATRLSRKIEDARGDLAALLAIPAVRRLMEGR